MGELSRSAEKRHLRADTYKESKGEVLEGLEVSAEWRSDGSVLRRWPDNNQPLGNRQSSNGNDIESYLM